MDLRTARRDSLDVGCGCGDLLAALAPHFAHVHGTDAERALTAVRRILRPGGRFLCVGLARPASRADQLWDVASMVPNPLIGWVRHPWVSHEPATDSPFPVLDPCLTVDEIRAVVDRVMPGAVMRRQMGFRHTIAWTKSAT